MADKLVCAECKKEESLAEELVCWGMAGSIQGSAFVPFLTLCPECQVPALKKIIAKSIEKKPPVLTLVK